MHASAASARQGYVNLAEHDRSVVVQLLAVQQWIAWRLIASPMP